MMVINEYENLLRLFRQADQACQVLKQSGGKLLGSAENARKQAILAEIRVLGPAADRAYRLRRANNA